MSQSNVIAAFLTLAFLVFITMKGELPVYLGFLLAEPKNTPGNPTIKTNANSPTNNASSGPFNLSGNSTTNANVNKTIAMGFSLFGM